MKRKAADRINGNSAVYRAALARRGAPSRGAGET